jgi:hypothetical protein
LIGSERRQRHGALRVFAVPMLLGALTAVGLLAALIGDGIWDAVSWLALGVPCAVIAWCWFKARRVQ